MILTLTHIKDVIPNIFFFYNFSDLLYFSKFPRNSYLITILNFVYIYASVTANALLFSLGYRNATQNEVHS